jgi:hypothetical protein
MTGTEWALLFLALAALAFLLVLSLLAADEAESRRMEQDARRRYMRRRTHPTYRGQL